MKKKIIYSIFICSILVIGGASWMYGQKQLSYTIPSHDDISKMRLDKFVFEKKYEIEYEFNYTQGSIFVNDISVIGELGEIGDGEINNYDINTYIFKPGLQKITIEIYPVNGQSVFNQYSSFDFKLKEVDKKNNGYHIIKDSLVTYSFKANEELSSKDKIVFEAEFVADVGYKNTLYDGAVDLNTLKPEELKDLVFSASSKLVENMLHKNYKNIEDVMYFSTQSSNLFNYRPIDSLSTGGMTKNLKFYFQSGFKFVNVNLEDVRYTILRDSRFVYVMLKNGGSIFTLRDEKLKITLPSPCVFFMPKGSNELFLF